MTPIEKMTVAELKKELEDCPGDCKKCGWNDCDNCFICDAFTVLDDVKDKAINTSAKHMLAIILDKLAEAIERDERAGQEHD